MITCHASAVIRPMPFASTSATSPGRSRSDAAVTPIPLTGGNECFPAKRFMAAADVAIWLARRHALRHQRAVGHTGIYVRIPDERGWGRDARFQPLGLFSDRG